MVSEVKRILKPGGHFVCVISHPCFCDSGSGWVMPAIDSWRGDERDGRPVDHYFRRGSKFAQWGDLPPVLGFHRPLRDYWQCFTNDNGFIVAGFEEPSITERGRKELKHSEVEKALRIPYSVIFKLVKPSV